MLDIAKIYEWNEEFWNKPWTYKTELEMIMLTEEFNETIKAMQEWNLVETIDWIVDIIFVAMGTLYKLWVPSTVVTQCFDSVIKSNFTKILSRKPCSFNSGMNWY